MEPTTSKSKIIIFDTTMREGEMVPGVQLDIDQKIKLAKLLEAMRVDVIEVGYPGAFKKDFDAIFMISKQIKQATICGLAGSRPDEIASVALAIRPAARGRINIFTPVHLKDHSELSEQQSLAVIQDSVALARDYSADVEWSAFDATRSNPDFLCKAVETAIQSGATTISIPDSLGLCSPEEFSELIGSLVNRVPNIDQAIVSVHCHDDLGLAVQNSLVALNRGARQIECSLNGLGARKGNADLGQVVTAIAQTQAYTVDLEIALLAQASDLVTQLTGIARQPSA